MDNVFFGAIVWAVISTFQSTLATSLAIGLIGEFAPSMIRHTVDTTEVHVRNSHRQWSLMTQMFIFLTFNAAIIIYLLTPVEDTLGAFNLQQVASVIGFSSIITPVLRFIQPHVYLWRRLQAPYAVNFIKQKSFFAPQVIDLVSSDLSVVICLDLTPSHLFWPNLRLEPNHYRENIMLKITRPSSSPSSTSPSCPTA
jgi:hypothetical protein